MTTVPRTPNPGATGYALFDTAIGTCGVGWTERGIAAVQLPEASEDRVRARLLRRLPDAVEGEPTPVARGAIDRITTLLAGTRENLSDIPLDMFGVPPFHQAVYRAARSVPAGDTVTYGAIADMVGSPGSARAVGQALGRNPFPIIVPCHRVLAAGGRSGGFSAAGGVHTKMAMLAAEGAMPSTARTRSTGKTNGTAKAGTAKRDTSGLRFDPAAAVAHLRASDDVLAAFIDTVGPCRLATRPTRSVFGGLAQAIVYQQLSNAAAATIHGRALALPGGRGSDLVPAQILGATEEQLRAVGLSRPKQLALRDLAERVESGALPSLAAIRRLDDDEVVEQLTQVRGIGRWTAEMFLIFRLGRPDVLPVDDFSLRKGFATVYNRPSATATDVASHGERWQPYRSVASWYLWRAVGGGL